MLAVMLFAPAQAAAPSKAENPGNLGEDLFYASTAASGSKLCNRVQAARYSRQFDSRYGKRIRALTRYHERQFGRDPDFIYTSDCRSSRAPRQQQDREHAQAMDRFEAILEGLEQRYGPTRSRTSKGS